MGNKSKLKQGNSSLGKALINAKKEKMRGLKVVSDLHAPDLSKKDKPQLKSQLEPNSLDDFMALAKLSNKKFEVERETEIVSEPTIVVKGNETSIVSSFAKKYQKNPTYVPLKIP